jgi:hypothetical protein
MLIQDALRPGCGFGPTEWGLDDLALTPKDSRKSGAGSARHRRRNLLTSAAESLRTLGHDVDTVADEGLAEGEDRVVLAAATGEARLLLTLDRGLGDI